MKNVQKFNIRTTILTILFQMTIGIIHGDLNYKDFMDYGFIMYLGTIALGYIISYNWNPLDTKYAESIVVQNIFITFCISIISVCCLDGWKYTLQNFDDLMPFWLGSIFALIISYFWCKNTQNQLS